MEYKLDQQQWVVRLGKYINGTFKENGSEIWFGGLDEGRGLDRVLGGEYLLIWLNEISEISYSALDTIKSSLAQKTGFKNKHLLYYPGLKELLGVVAGSEDDPFSGKYGEMSARMFFDQNPPKKSHWSYKVFIEGLNPDRTVVSNPESYGWQRMNPDENKENVEDDYLELLGSLSEKKKKRFLYGEFDDDETSSLFSESNLNLHRKLTHPELKKIVIGVDPGVTSSEKSDATGIVVAGLGFDDTAYVLEDKSGIYTPSEWANIVYNLFKKWDADYVVAEKNQGGDLVERNITVEYPNIPIKTVWATKGKILRAEPVSTIYEKGRVSHVGSFPDLEYEMVTYTGDKREQSPNRLDALVYAIIELFPIEKMSSLEMFNREKIKFFDEYDFTESISIGFIKITKADNYNFTMISAKIKNKSVFVTNAIFNNYIPFENIEEIKRIVQEDSISKIFIECDISYSAFSRELYLMELCQIQGIRPMDNEENRILVESKFITEKFVFKKDHEDIQYKDFIRQFHRYTSVAEKDEVFAPDAICGLSVAVKKMYSEYI